LTLPPLNEQNKPLKKSYRSHWKQGVILHSSTCGMMVGHRC